MLAQQGWAVLRLCWAHLEARLQLCWAILNDGGAMMAHLGQSWALCWGSLEVCWAVLGQGWAVLRLCWAHLGPYVGPSWTYVEDR